MSSVTKGTFPSHKVAKIAIGGGMHMTNPTATATDELNRFMLPSNQKKACGILSSTFPTSESGMREGDPIADFYSFYVRGDLSIAAMADGVGFGHNKVDASRCATQAFVEYLSGNDLPRDLKDFAILLGKAITFSHQAILKAMALIWLLSLLVFIWEMKVSGSPRVPEPSKAHLAVRVVLRIVLIVSFFIVAVVHIAVIALTAKSTSLAVYQSNKSSAAAWIQWVFTSIIELALVFVVGFYSIIVWFRRLRNPSESFFASSPATVQHMLANEATEMAVIVRAIKFDCAGRILLVWVLGLGIALYGDARLLSLTGRTQVAGTFEIGALVISLVIWLLVSISLTLFWLRAKRRELQIIEGNYTGTRNKLAAVVFAIILIVGLLFGLATLASATYYVVLNVEEIVANKDAWKHTAALTIQEMLKIWPLIIFFIALMVDTLISHLRNSQEQRSVITRSSAPLNLSLEFSNVLPSTFSYANLDTYDF